MIEEILKVFKGRKTYLVAALMAIATFAYAMEWIDTHVFVAIQGALIPSGLATLRAGVGGSK